MGSGRVDSSQDENIYARISHVSGYMISEWRASAKNLIYHFRCVLKGMIPFSPSWNASKQELAELDHASLSYIRSMTKLLEERSKYAA